MVDREKLISIVDRFASADVAVFGDVLLDWYWYGKNRRLNPEKPARPLTSINRMEYLLGGAGNVASNLKALGARSVALYSPLGDDNWGAEIERLCASSGINLVRRTIPFGTIVKHRVIGSDGEYHGRNDLNEENSDGASLLHPITAEDEEFFYRTLIGSSPRPKAIVFSDYDKHMLKGNLAARAIEWANREEIVTVVDPKPANAQRFRGATVIRPNKSEATKIVGEDGLKREELARRLKEKIGTKYAVVTLGSEGMVTYDGGFAYIPTHAKQVTDVTGAGDTVAAAMTLALVSGATIEEAARIGNYAAGIKVEKVGTVAIRSEELIERIRNDNL